MADSNLDASSGFFGFESGLTKHIAGLATFFLTVGGFAWTNHFVIPGLWIVTLGGFISTLAYCVGYRKAAHSTKMVVLVVATGFLVSAASYVTYLFRAHPETINNTTTTTTQSGAQSESHTTNSAQTAGDHSPAVAGNGNTVTYSGSEDNDKPVHRKKK